MRGMGAVSPAGALKLRSRAAECRAGAVVAADVRADALGRSCAASEVRCSSCQTLVHHGHLCQHRLESGSPLQASASAVRTGGQCPAG